MITEKIILTSEELTNILMKTYDDAFDYGKNYEEHWKNNKSSKGKDACSYVDNLINKITK